MSDRTSSSSTGGLAGQFEDLARRVRALEQNVDQLRRADGHPTPTFLWVPKAEGSELWVQHVVTGNSTLIAGPL